MATHFPTLLKNNPPWLSSPGEIGDVVLASLGRLVRNLPGHAFPGWSEPEDRRAVVETLLPALLSRPGFKTAFHADMSELNLQQRRILLERKLITPCMAARQDGCHVIIPRKQDVAVMLNEEEHLVAHFFQPGFNFRNVMTDMQRFATGLEKDIPFARDHLNGYLTSLPSESGEGMQLYAVLHLPGFVMANMMDQITRAAEKLQVNIVPFYHGMQAETGNTYVFFTNTIPRGESETCMEEFAELIHTLLMREIQVRAKVQYSGSLQLADQLGRAFGLLSYAVQLSYQEMLDALSMLRLGTDCCLMHWELPEDEILGRLASLNYLLAPAHLAQMDGGKTTDDLLPVLRALHVRDTILEAGPQFPSPHPLNASA